MRESNGWWIGKYQRFAAPYRPHEPGSINYIVLFPTGFRYQEPYELAVCRGTAPAPRLVMMLRCTQPRGSINALLRSHGEGLARDQSEAFRLGLLFESFRMDAGRGSISLSLDFAQCEAGLQLITQVAVSGGLCNHGPERLSGFGESARRCLHAGIGDGKHETLLPPLALAKQGSGSADCLSGCRCVPFFQRNGCQQAVGADLVTGVFMFVQ